MAKGKRELTDSEFYSRHSRRMINTSTKLIWLLTINGILWIWCSYLLAWFDKVQIAESLSSNVCNVVIGQTLGYLITKTIENVFRYNPKFGGDSTYPEDVANRSAQTTVTADVNPMADMASTLDENVAEEGDYNNG